MKSEHQEKGVRESVEKLNKKKLLVDGKIVLKNDSDITKIFKKDLINYLIHLNALRPNLFNNHRSFESFLKEIQKRTKLNIVDVINYYHTNRGKNITYHVDVKGTESPELVEVYVKKVVSKVVKRNAA